MKTHYSISELLEMNLEKFPKTNRAILYKVEREKWSFIEASCQGGKNGKRREYLFRPQVMRTVQRGEVSLFNNTYYSAELTEFNGEKVRVGYDVQDALWVWIYDDVGRLICKAEWHGNSTDYMPVSVLERAEDKRNDERLKRNELQQQNILKERRVPTIEHQDSVNIGGMVMGMAEVKAKAALLAERRSRADDVTVETVEVKAVKRPSETEAAAGWSVHRAKPQRRRRLLRSRPAAPPNQTRHHL